MKRGGFTLIELLIVVAIIAILAAIAVPNFLEAQTRSKVSRTKTDLRTTATALEAYAIDHNTKYPSDAGNGAGGVGGPTRTGIYRAYAQPPNSQTEPKANFTIGFELTTPVAYLSSIAPLKDPFQTTRYIDPSSAITGRNFYAFFNVRLRREHNGSPTSFVLTEDRIGQWCLYGAGPDRFVNNVPGGGDYSNVNNIPRLRNYDATNGTVSNGDIYRSHKMGDGAPEIVTNP
jgi:prepilin-type N-terminal cleavage/methylation domain-containing protein